MSGTSTVRPGLAQGVDLGRRPVASPVEPSEPTGPAEQPAPARRVRHEVRDSLAVMAFSAATSCGLALVLVLAVRFGN